jgi:hypothetical protein
MALEIKRTKDGGVILCAPVCTRLTREDVAMLEKQARAYHTKLHAGEGQMTGSALGPDIIGDLDGDLDGAFMDGDLDGDLDGDDFGSALGPEIIGDRLDLVSGRVDNPGGHVEIMGSVSNREFLRERRHMGGFYEEVGERFPADDVGRRGGGRGGRGGGRGGRRGGRRGRRGGRGGWGGQGFLYDGPDVVAYPVFIDEDDEDYRGRYGRARLIAGDEPALRLEAPRPALAPAYTPRLPPQETALKAKPLHEGLSPGGGKAKGGGMFIRFTKRF